MFKNIKLIDLKLREPKIKNAFLRKKCYYSLAMARSISIASKLSPFTCDNLINAASLYLRHIQILVLKDSIYIKIRNECDGALQFNLHDCTHKSNLVFKSALNNTKNARLLSLKLTYISCIYRRLSS